MQIAQDLRPTGQRLIFSAEFHLKVRQRQRLWQQRPKTKNQPRIFYQEKSNTFMNSGSIANLYDPVLVPYCYNIPSPGLFIRRCSKKIISFWSNICLYLCYLHVTYVNKYYQFKFYESIFKIEEVRFFFADFNNFFALLKSKIFWKRKSIFFLTRDRYYFQTHNF